MMDCKLPDCFPVSFENFDNFEDFESVSGIAVSSASYGVNCNSSNSGNKTTYFQGLANGKTNYSSTFNYQDSGADPSPGCAKNLQIEYNCSGGPNQTFILSPEAGVGGAINLGCSNGLNILKATYGGNCNNTNLVGNKTTYFQGLVPSGTYSLNTKFNYQSAGDGKDPAPGCAKTLEIVYNCSGGSSQIFSVPAEAGLGSVVNITCPAVTTSPATTTPSTPILTPEVTPPSIPILTPEVTTPSIYFPDTSSPPEIITFAPTTVPAKSSQNTIIIVGVVVLLIIIILVIVILSSNSKNSNSEY